MIRLAFQALVGFMNQAGAISYSVADAASLGHAGQLVVANHPSLIDIVLLLAFVPGAAWRNPSMAIAFSAAGFVPNSPTDEMIERAAALLAAGECVFMFPEGTRTVPRKPLHFHRGAASMTIRSARQITPVFIRPDPPHLSKRVPWHRVSDRRPHYSIAVGAHIDPAPLRAGPAPAASQALNEILTNVYAARSSTL